MSERLTPRIGDMRVEDENGEVHIMSTQVILLVGDIMFVESGWIMETSNSCKERLYSPGRNWCVEITRSTCIPVFL